MSHGGLAMALKWSNLLDPYHFEMGPHHYNPWWNRILFYYSMCIFILECLISELAFESRISMGDTLEKNQPQT